MRRSVTAMVVVVLFATSLVVADATATSADVQFTGHDEEAQAALALLPYVPTEFRNSCLIADSRVSSPFDAFREYDQYIEAALYCRPEDGLTAYYYQFPGPNSLNGAYDSFFVGGNSNLGTFDSDSECGVEGTWSIKGKTIGRYACYEGNTAYVEPTAGAKAAVAAIWTDTRSNILATGVRSDGDDRALMNWYNDGAGPLTEPDDDGVPEVLSGAEQQRVANRLWRHIPRQLRADCQTFDLNLPGELSPYPFSARIWMRAGVRCTPTTGADTALYLAFSDADTANAYLEAFDVTSDNDAANCPAEGTYKVGRRRIGSYRCFFTDDAGHAAILWTHDALAVVGDASRQDDDSTQLLDWWRSSGGPN